MIPLSTDRPTRRQPVVNYVLVVLNVLVAIYMARLSTDDWAMFVYRFGFQSLYPEWWQFVTSAFLHGGLGHLIGNMVFLWVFGNAVEDRLGHLGYGLFYLAGAILTAVGHGLTDLSPAIGASGAISAVAGAFLVLFPQTRVRILVIFFIIGVYNIPSLWFIGFNIARDVFGWAFFAGNVAYTAHLSGYVVGALTALGLLYFRILIREPYDLMTMISQWNRRRQFRAVTRQGFDPWTGVNPTRRRGRKSADRTSSTGGASGRGEASASRPSPEDEDLAREEARRRGVTSTAWQDAHGDKRHALSESEEQELMWLRSRISEAAVGHDLDAALVHYRRLLDLEPESVLNRDLQLTVANQLMREGDHARAAEAYRRLLSAYPTADPTGQVRLVLALLLVRYLDQSNTEEARRTIEEAMSRLPDGPDRNLGRELAAAAGIAISSDVAAAARARSEDAGRARPGEELSSPTADPTEEYRPGDDDDRSTAGR